MAGASDLNGSQSQYSMAHIHHESNYFILLQHKSICLDGQLTSAALALLCRAQLHVEQIMLLHSLAAHLRRQSTMFHAGQPCYGTALKSTGQSRRSVVDAVVHPARALRHNALGVLVAFLPLLTNARSRPPLSRHGGKNCSAARTS